MRWSLETVWEDDEERLAKLLDDGYEPFTVTRDDRQIPTDEFCTRERWEPQNRIWLKLAHS